MRNLYCCWTVFCFFSRMCLLKLHYDTSRVDSPFSALFTLRAFCLLCVHFNEFEPPIIFFVCTWIPYFVWTLRGSSSAFCALGSLFFFVFTWARCLLLCVYLEPPLCAYLQLSVFMFTWNHRPSLCAHGATVFLSLFAWSHLSFPLCLCSEL